MQVRPRFGRIRDTIHHPTSQIMALSWQWLLLFCTLFTNNGTQSKENKQKTSTAGFDKLHEDTVGGRKSGTVGRYTVSLKWIFNRQLSLSALPFP